jgi:hypothetical protein
MVSRLVWTGLVKHGKLSFRRRTFGWGVCLFERGLGQHHFVASLGTVRLDSLQMRLQTRLSGFLVHLFHPDAMQTGL